MSKLKDLKFKLAFSGAFNLIEYAPEKFAKMASTGLMKSTPTSWGSPK